MFFKNLQIYRLPENWNIGIQKLSECLERGPFVKCPSNLPKSRGWVSPTNNGELVYSLAGQWLIAMKTEEKILPSSVVNDALKELADHVEKMQGYKPGRKQLKEIKERVIEELMPRAFTKHRTTNIWIDPFSGWFVVDAASQNKAEEVIEHLRHCLDDFPLTMLHTKLSPVSAMADWIACGDAPAGFTIDRDCELKSVDEEKSAVKFTHYSLDDGKAKEHLAEGKLPTKLALTFDNRISFVLTDKMEVKRVALLDIIECEKADNAQEQFDSDFALMTGEFKRLIAEMVEDLGGEVKEE